MPPRRLVVAHSRLDPDAGTHPIAAPVANNSDVTVRKTGEDQRRPLDVGLKILLIEEVVDEWSYLEPALPEGNRGIDEDIALQCLQRRLTRKLRRLLLDACWDPIPLAY